MKQSVARVAEEWLTLRVHSIVNADRLITWQCGDEQVCQSKACCLWCRHLLQAMLCVWANHTTKRGFARHGGSFIIYVVYFKKLSVKCKVVPAHSAAPRSAYILVTILTELSENSFIRPLHKNKGPHCYNAFVSMYHLHKAYKINA